MAFVRSQPRSATTTPHSPSATFLRCMSLAFLITICFVLVGCDRRKKPSMVETSSISLPRVAGAWSRTDGPQRIAPQDIFAYMDGAGELYLGYRFKFLEAYHYRNPEQEEILVELYWMETSDDAYGLLSGDWGGEPVQLQSPVPDASRTRSGAGQPRALYGAGLLRLWSDNLFARVLADRETEASKRAVLDLGRAIVAGRRSPPPPTLATALPDRVEPNFAISADRGTFLRSHLALNSAYFLSSENLLDLGPGCEVATAPYGQLPGKNTRKKNKPVRLLLVRYPDAALAQKALDHFVQGYLPDKGIHVAAAGANQPAVVSLEDGWMGTARSGRILALVFESPDERSARTFIEKSTQILANLEASRD